MFSLHACGSDRNGIAVEDPNVRMRAFKESKACWRRSTCAPRESYSVSLAQSCHSETRPSLSSSIVKMLCLPFFMCYLGVPARDSREMIYAPVRSLTPRPSSQWPSDIPISSPCPGPLDTSPASARNQRFFTHAANDSTSLLHVLTEAQPMKSARAVHKRQSNSRAA